MPDEKEKNRITNPVEEMPRLMPHPPPNSPTKFIPEYHIQLAYNYTLLGSQIQDLANLFDVSKFVINKWRKNYPQFNAAIKEGGAVANATVARAIYHRATGFTVRLNKEKIVNGKRMKYEVEEYYPPDVEAAKYWLGKKDPKNWPDKKVVELTISVEDQIRQLTDQEATLFEKLVLTDQSHRPEEALALIKSQTLEGEYSVDTNE